MSHDDKLIQLVRVLRENMIESSDGSGERGENTKAKQDHAAMGLMLYEDKLTEITVLGDENSLLLVRGSENIAVWQPCWVIPGHSRDIVPLVG